MKEQHPKMILDSKYKHPLTYEIANEIYPHDPNGHQYYCGDWHEHMQAGANWQLEQCITWLENLDPKHSTLAKMMREAMRPQQDN